MTLTPAGRYVAACLTLTVLLLAVGIVPHLTGSQLVAVLAATPVLVLAAAMEVAAAITHARTHEKGARDDH